MQRGASVPLNEIIRHITRGKTNKLSAASLLEYFRPLRVWLQDQNRRNGPSIIGWNSNLEDVKLFKSSGSKVSEFVSKYLILFIVFCKFLII